MSAEPENPSSQPNSSVRPRQKESVSQHRHPVARFRIDSALVFTHAVQVCKCNALERLLNSEEK